MYVSKTKKEGGGPVQLRPRESTGCNVAQKLIGARYGAHLSGERQRNVDDLTEAVFKPYRLLPCRAGDGARGALNVLHYILADHTLPPELVN